MDTARLTERKNLFVILRPSCVKIAQLAIHEPSSAADAQEILPLVRQILDLLTIQVQRDPTVLDEQLADYVNYPLTSVFKHVDQYPMLLIETCIKCLILLIVHGWKSKISSKLVQQYLIYLTFILDGDPGSTTKRDVPEETTLEALRALRALFNSAASHANAAAGLVASEAIPALGHAITVILEAIVGGANPQIQTEAVYTIESVYTAIKDQAALANFLPGTISSLTKVLSSPSRYKSQVITKCIDAVRLTLTKVLGDIQTRSILAKAKNEAEDASSTEEKTKLISPAWLKATTAQVKVALAKIMKIRTNDSVEVRQSLCKLCISLLDECHVSLANCADFLTETAIMLDPGQLKDPYRPGLETSLRDLAVIYPELSETIKAIVYNWMTGLPHTAQASDERVKKNALRSLTQGLGILRDLHVESSTLDDLLSGTLRDVVTTLIAGSGPSLALQSSNIQLLTDGSREMALGSSNQLGSVILNHEGQREMKSELMTLLDSIATSSQQTRFAATMMEGVRDLDGDAQVAAFWLCFEVVKYAQQASAEDDALLNLSAFDEPSESIEKTFSDIYAFSVQVLDTHTDLSPSDWRMEAIALQVVSHAAQRTGPSFRPELIDVLFPISTFLGSESPELQQYAMVTLNSLALSCDYGNVSELIIDNVDYMVNAVSLRLNTLDISPASTKVLTMMIRLSGPRIIPFLDDVVESIFVALENYHAYSSFVESLFAVLRETVAQGAQSDALLLEGQKESQNNHRKKPREPEGLNNLLEFVKQRRADMQQEEAELDAGEIRGHPTTPWKRDQDKGPNGADDGESVDDGEAGREEPKPPNSPTYQLLTRITTLTQYYLTSPVPELRKTLLEILTTASSALAADEDSFLLLINAVWPVVVARLRDEESFVVIEACQALCYLCESAGDFLSSRFKTEWAQGLAKWCRRAKQQATNRTAKAPRANSSENDANLIIPIRSVGGLEAKPPIAGSVSAYSGSLGQHAAPLKVWEAVVKLLASVVSFVRIDDGMFEEILDLLGEAMERDVEVRQALENINADAVWLMRYERGLVRKMSPPTVEDVTFTNMQV